MPEFSLFAGAAPVAVYVGDNGGVFTNTGPSTVYYGKTAVSTTSYDGTLATNASVTLYGSPHFTIGRTSEGASRADMEYVLSPAAAAGTATTTTATTPGSLIGGRPLVATRLASRQVQTFSDTLNSKVRHVARERCSGIYLTYGPGMTSDMEIPNQLFLRASITTPTGVKIDGACRGQKVATIDGLLGGTATFGPFPIELQVGDVFYSQVRQWHGAGDGTTLAATANIGDTSVSLNALPRLTSGGFAISSYSAATTNAQELVTVTGITGAGPYTATLSKALTKAHPSGRGFGMVNPVNLWLYSDYSEGYSTTIDVDLINSGVAYTTLNATAAGTVSVASNAGDTQITLSKAFNVPTLTIGAGGTVETVTVRSYTAAGANVYYLNAPLAFAHSIGENASTTIGLGQLGVAPVAITADNVYGTRKKSVFIAGDSIAEEVGYLAPRRDQSYASRACESLNKAYLKTAIQSEAAQNFNALTPLTTIGTGAAGVRRRALESLCDIFYYEYGTNDLTSQTLPQLQALVTTACSQAKANGMKVVVSTITPRTTSTDSFATLANQTKALTGPQETIRTSYNTWVRAGAGGLADAVDDADLLLDSTQVGKWDPPGAGEPGPRTADGLHPAGNGHEVRATYLASILSAL